MKRLVYCIALALSVAGVSARSAFAQASAPYLGEIQIFAFNFCPTGWLPLNGELLPISQNEALFALIGNTYGGDGVSTFAVPKWGRIFTANGQSLLPCMAIQGVFPSQN
jgi:microcystin-dependent protein